MAITRVGSATSTSNTITIPSHAVGDFIVCFAYNEGTTVIPALPTGWRTIYARGVDSQGVRVGYKIAESSSETSGTWTDADAMICAVYRSDVNQRLSVGMANEDGSGGSTSMNYNVISSNLARSNNVWLIAFAGRRATDSSVETAPSSFTNVTSVVGTGLELALHDSNANLASFVGATVAVGGTSCQSRSCVFQLEEVPPVSSSGGAPLIGRGGLVY